MMSMLNFGENTLQVVCTLSHTDGQVSQDTGTIVMSTSTRLIFITKLTAEKRKVADYVDEATRKANWYHAKAMLKYFGKSGYNVLSDADIAKYEKMEKANK